MNDVKMFIDTFFGSSNNRNDSIIQMPNNIFYMLAKGSYRSGKQMLFAFNYYLVVSWVYRYCKIVDIIENSPTTYGKTMKILSGISPSTKSVDYIIKSNGVLDNIGLTKTIPKNDVPVLYHFNSYENSVEFSYFGEYQSKLNIKNTVFKKPLLHTDNRMISDTEYLGAYNDYDFTFTINILDYIYMLVVMKLDFDVVAFYYYLVSLSYYHDGMIKLSRLSMASQLGVSEKTITKYKHILAKNDLIYESSHSPHITRKNNTIRIRKVVKDYGTSNVV